MKEIFLLSKEEKREIESISNIILSVTNSFETFTANEFDGEENENKLDSIEELRSRMKYDMEQLEKAYIVITKILYGTYDETLSVKDYELSK